MGVLLWDPVLKGKSAFVAVAGFSAVKLPLVPGAAVSVSGEAIARSGCASPTADRRRQVGGLLVVRLVVVSRRWSLLPCWVVLVGCLVRLDASVKLCVTGCEMLCVALCVAACAVLTVVQSS